jgi:hypothetical protein
MLPLEKKLLLEYKPLVIKMNDDFLAIEVGRTTFGFLCDV